MPKFKTLTRIQGLPQKGNLVLAGEIIEIPADFPGLAELIENKNLEPVTGKPENTPQKTAEPAQDSQTDGPTGENTQQSGKPSQPKKKG